MFFLCGTQNIFKTVWHLLGRNSHPPRASTLHFHFGTLVFVFCAFQFISFSTEYLSESQDSASLCVSFKHELTLSKSKSVNKGNHEPESL